MDNKRTGLWWADRLRITLAVLLLIAAMLGKAGSVVGLILVFLVLAVFLVVEFTMNRCPHCGRYLERNRGKFCQHCGERIREDKPDT